MKVGQLAGFFVVVKALQFLIVFSTPVIQFDTSTRLFLEQLAKKDDIASWWNARFWNKIVSWDAVFFLKTAIRGGVSEFEHEHAFSQLWSRFIMVACRGNLDFYHVLKTAVVLENCLLLCATLLLYLLTVKSFEANALKSHHRHHLAQKTAILFISSSASGYFLSVYSEPLSAFLAFLGMLFREYAIFYDAYGNLSVSWIKWPLYSLASTFCFTLAFINRPNCILLGLYYVNDLVKLLKTKSFGKAFFMPFISGFCMFCFFVHHQYYEPYQTFCPERGAWCLKQILNLPLSHQSFYAFIQSHYWNVGFLRYWSPNNIPNFIFALPTIIVLWYSTVYFSHQYPCSNLKPLVLLTRIFLIILIFFAHTQVINRVSSFIPLHLWYVADRLNKLNVAKDADLKGDDKLIRFYVVWLIFWAPLQTALFASFLPPA
ncbi:LANO_0C03686g1_1 [Lachancea nothofagi CBS 11611]|uniref:GPI mannosyltransferase 2 n=1 Tax=Lachancea nothofagi CBS 11611 TaxID=1266666 RepID=A0A1G4J5X8_9SACH|nr:LANO_0C03686g1_1 [Lachancea nothofagi CBS 11611]